MDLKEWNAGYRQTAGAQKQPRLTFDFFAGHQEPEVGLGAGAGFGGLAVALLGRSRLLGLVLAALFFGTLQQGGLAINAHVPREVMDVLEGVVILAVALADVRVRARLGVAR